MDASIYLSVVIPAYDEENRIGATIADINAYLSRQNYSYEIIVVNDGSNDNTASAVKNILSDFPALKLIDNENNQGKGVAVKQGMLEARGSYRIYVDADNAISITHIEKFWPYIKEGYNIAIGSIEIEGAVKKEKYAGYRKILGKLSKYLIRFLTIWEIHDTQRAFKLFPADAAIKIFSKQTIKRWGFDIEILVIAKSLGYKIKELPVEWINPFSNKINLAAFFSTFKELLRIKLNLMAGKYK